MPCEIRHKTTYTYEAPVAYGLQKVRMRPLTGPMQAVQAWDVTVEGGRIEASYTDHYGNHTDLVSTTPGATTLTLTAAGRVEVHDKAGVLGPVYGRAPLWHFAESTALTQPNEEMEHLAETISDSDQVTSLHALSDAILARAPYKTGVTDVDTSAAEAMALGGGVCQDHTHIFLAIARLAGVPARYVSGYLHMPDRTEQDASHAWAEAHIADLGWVGFDVSNSISPDANYVRLAVGRDARDATPISGMRMGAGDAGLIVSLQVQQ